MKKIPIHLDDIGSALGDQGGCGGHQWYLDLRNGELLLVSDFADLPEEYGDIEDQPEVFLPVEQRPSRDGFAGMEEFVESLPESEVRRALARSLRLPKPFRSFKDTLSDFPEDREAWFRFLGDRQRQAAIRFLEENEVPWVEAPPPTA